jgi:hypothetical protein
MKRVYSGILIGLACAGSLAFAQESFTAAYDSSRQVTLKGPVARIAWVNPHAYLFIDVRDRAGIVATWEVEFGNPLELEAEGWTSESLKIGDVIAVQGFPARGDASQAFAKSVVLVRTGERLFTPRAVRRAAPAATPAPRWPDGQIRLGPPPGKTGYWGAASANTLVEDIGREVPMNKDGLLLNLADADRVAPFQPWAKALYEYRQRTLLKNDPMERCIPPGGPRQFQSPP